MAGTGAGAGAGAGAGRLTTHVLDLARGGPAAGVEVKLYSLSGAERMLLREAVTSADGRTGGPLLEGTDMKPGLYELEFDVGAYFRQADEAEDEAADETEADGQAGFFGLVPIRFRIVRAEEHYHVPLLAAPGGYSTYRGS
ncbi:hydroxyisourate hydrolase [Paenibacillus pinistramenti]|uniref:hydroxyisourate hydrolase n=1 Tax=Paenibacillus pinistramenti TaxID=1768003 RepID=UPI001108C143|nr:hydroxyisourate hydrolase [Paenibacillus pinistramenti]